MRLLSWVDSVRGDVVFAWRQLRKHKVATAVAIVSLGLASGACTCVFRLVDGLLLRPLPVSDPDRLYAMFTRGYDPGGHLRLGESNEYPQFRAMRAAVARDAELIAASYGERVELTWSSDQQIEKAHRQFVSGWMFEAFGLKPAVGRLLTESDDDRPRAHPFAILSNEYWTRRFGRDPQVVGRSFRIDHDLYRVIGVAPPGFTGTEPGTMTDIFLPTMMYEGVTHDDWSWIRTFVRMKPGASVTAVRDRLQAVFQAIQQERAKTFVGWPKRRLENFLSQHIVVLPAAAGVSGLQQEYRRPLTTLAVLVSMVLLIACANVANLFLAGPRRANGKGLCASPSARRGSG